jgi:predicted nucleic acid-binding protein
MTVAIMDSAFATRSRFGISYWDAAIIEASRALGCALILSEDLDPGTDFDGVRIENPFR